MSDEAFDQWAIIELMGHQRMAGRVTEQQLGGIAFIRVDVPESAGERQAFTRLLGPSAIFAINIVTEDVARAAASNYRQEPVTAFDFPARSRLPARNPDDEAEDDEIPI